MTCNGSKTTLVTGNNDAQWAMKTGRQMTRTATAV
jgi:hypothetical protein